MGTGDMATGILSCTDRRMPGRGAIDHGLLAGPLGTESNRRVLRRSADGVPDGSPDGDPWSARGQAAATGATGGLKAGGTAARPVTEIRSAIPAATKPRRPAETKTTV